MRKAPTGRIRTSNKKCRINKMILISRVKVNNKKGKEDKCLTVKMEKINNSMTSNKRRKTVNSSNNITNTNMKVRMEVV